MTEFLKGYAAGANDMEAGRLVRRDPVLEPDGSTSWRPDIEQDQPEEET